MLLAGGMLGLGVMVIVGNTIRLDIQNRRDEIEVTKLVGGSDAFVRRPFLYNGFWYGLGGARHGLGHHPRGDRHPAGARSAGSLGYTAAASSWRPWTRRPQRSCS